MSGEFCTSSGRVSQVGLLRCVYRRSHGLHTHARTCARARARAHTHTCLAIHTQSSNYFPARLPGKTSKWQLEVYQLGLQSMATTRTAAGCPLPPARSPCCLSSSPSKSVSFGPCCALRFLRRSNISSWSNALQKPLLFREKEKAPGQSVRREPQPAMIELAYHIFIQKHTCLLQNRVLCRSCSPVLCQRWPAVWVHTRREMRVEIPRRSTSGQCKAHLTSIAVAFGTAQPQRLQHSLRAAVSSPS